MDKLEFIEIKGERSRVYTFPGQTVRVENVVKLCVRPSGTHRLETASGQKFIIAPSWLSIAIDADAWCA